MYIFDEENMSNNGSQYRFSLTLLGGVLTGLFAAHKILPLFNKVTKKGAFATYWNLFFNLFDLSVLSTLIEFYEHTLKNNLIYISKFIFRE